MIKGIDHVGIAVKSIEEANSAQIAFGELRYWLTDLAVSQLTMAERNADRRAPPTAAAAAERRIMRCSAARAPGEQSRCRKMAGACLRSPGNSHALFRR